MPGFIVIQNKLSNIIKGPMTGEKPMKKVRIVGIFLILSILLCFAGMGFAESSGDVYVVPIKGVIDRGIAMFVKRCVNEAEKNEAQAIIFEIDTPGGEVNAAVEISNTILNTSVPTISFINNEATSAGVIIAVSSDTIYMTSHATIGAAETRPNEEKYISYWSSKLRAVAEKTGRNPELVAAMADADVVIEGLKPKGKILSLTAKQAEELELADGIVANRSEALKANGINDADIIEQKPSMAEYVAQFVTNPYISPIILTIGIVCIIMELLLPGYGLFAFIGLLAFGLFFGANFMIGSARIWTIALFILGILLLLIEMFIPGFGIFGISGIVSVIIGLMMSFPNPVQAFYSITFAVIASCVISYFLGKYLVKTPVFDRIILNLKQEKSQGYLAFSDITSEFLNREGIALTTLRPAGSADFDGQKLDVLADGEFIPAGSKIRVIRVEGSKIVVKKIIEEA